MIVGLIHLLAGTILIQGGTIVDGSGRPRFTADLRIEGQKIAAIGHLSPRPGEQIVDARGMMVAPGFIDAHSHADSTLDALDSQLRQGITTAICGQDGGRSVSVKEQRESVRGAALRFEFFSGHGGLREAVMKTTLRKAAPFEIRQMAELLEEDMKAGALGLSTGLEYDPGFQASTEELIALAKVASRHGGMYISHVRDESAGMLKSVAELIRIGREAHLPAQVSHIKLGVTPVWNQADKVEHMIESANGGDSPLPQFTADVYPYTFWQSTIRVLTASRDYGNPKVWEAALADVGGPGNVRLTNYSIDRTWQGKTLEQLAKQTGRSAPELIIEIINRTADDKGTESVLVTAMTEADLTTFMRQPWVMFSSDGAGGISHPRGAGSFPKVLGRYVRDQKVLTLEEAIRKMTSFPAARFRLADRGLVKVGYAADLVMFDAQTVRDTSTPENPTSAPVGIKHVFVLGRHHPF
jgi:N-acyl-D-amino-acid deacylase